MEETEHRKMILSLEAACKNSTPPTYDLDVWKMLDMVTTDANREHGLSITVNLSQRLRPFVW